MAQTQQISERRKRVGLTQGEMARLVGISVSQIWRIENNDSGTTQPVKDAIERVLTDAERRAA